MKRLILLALAMVLCVLPGCDRQPVKEEKTSIRIGVTLYDEYDTFISELMGHFTAQAKDLEREREITITILRENADNVQTVQNSQVERFIEAGCDVICVNLVDRTDVAMIIDMVEAAEIPVIFFNRELVEEDLGRGSRLYYVGASAVESGRMQGRIVADLCQRSFERVDRNGDGVLQYVMLEGQTGHQDAIMRTEYSVLAVSEAGFDLERLEDEIANWSRSQAETRMSQWLERHGDSIEVVFANNDDMALGALDALKRAGIPYQNWPVVVGIDGTQVGLEAVALGEMTGTVLNDSLGQAQGMLDLAFALAMEQPLPPLQNERYIRLPYQIITLDNVMEFANRS